MAFPSTQTWHWNLRTQMKGSRSNGTPDNMLNCGTLLLAQRDVYVAEFRENLFHGSGVYQFEDPDTGRTAGYTAIWESGRRVGGEPELWLQSKMGVWEKVGGN